MGIAIEVGFVAITSDEYHSNKEAVGHSALVKILTSPAHFNEAQINPPEPSAAMELGTAFHAALLEPDVFAAKYAVIEEAKLAGALVSLDDYKAAAATLGITVGKMRKDELRAAIQAQNDPRFKFREDVMADLYGGKSILSAGDMSAVRAMAASLMAHRGAAGLLAKGMAEMSGFWVDQETGIMCKFRPDWIAQDAEGRYIGMVDAKKARSASKDAFQRAITNFGYDVQAAFYTDGMKALTGRTVPFYFAPVEDAAPYAAAVYKASDEMIAHGRAKYRAALQLLKWCRENGSWPSYQPFGEIEEIDPPRWDSFNTEAEA
jgi:hypothetical protein